MLFIRSGRERIRSRRKGNKPLAVQGAKKYGNAEIITGLFCNGGFYGQESGVRKRGLARGTDRA